MTWVLWNLISDRLEIVLVSVEDRCTVCAKRTTGSDIVLTHRWYSWVTRLKWKLLLVRLEIVLILTQDRCMACVERTIGLDIILDAPDGTPS